MAMADLSNLTAPFTVVFSTKERLMAMENSTTLMVQAMKDSGLETCVTVKAKKC